MVGPPADLAWVEGLPGDPGLEARVRREREAQHLYLRSEVLDDLAAATAAARASRGTRFFLYRFGCAPAQLEALERSAARETYLAQTARCAPLIGR